MNTKIPEHEFQQACALLGEKFHPAAILLFGSHVSGKVHHGSDVDIALLINRAQLPDAIVIARARTDIEALFRRDADLIVLDNASPILVMDILRHHRVLSLINPDALTDFTIKTTGAYFDLKYTRRPIEEKLLAS